MNPIDDPRLLARGHVSMAQVFAHMTPSDKECRQVQVASDEALRVKVGEIGQMSLAGANKLGGSAYETGGPAQGHGSMTRAERERADRERERERDRERVEKEREGVANPSRKVLNSSTLDLDPSSSLSSLLAGPIQASTPYI